MVDVNDVKSISELLSQVTEGFSHFFTNMESTLEKLAGIPNLLHSSNDSLNKTTESAKNASTALDKTHESSIGLLKSIEDFGGVAWNTFKAIGSGSQENVDSLGKLNDGVLDVLASITLMSLGAPKVFDGFNQSSKDVASDISGTLLPSFDKLIDIASRTTHFPLLDEFRKVVDVTLPAIDTVNNLENSLLALHGSSGDLTKVFDQTGASETNLIKLTNEFNNGIARTAVNTGASVASIIAFSNEILKIPELYGKIITTNLSHDISFTEAAMKVARGTTQNYADVLGIVSSQYENMGIKGQAPLELMSRMYGVSQTLGIPFNFISSQVKSISEQFKFLGDNTQGALNIIEGLGPKLLESRLGPKAVQELIGGVVSSINNLDIAQKSLLSSRTGGAGGLQGGFQIDQLLAQGKVDEVYKKMETALKQQFGGKVTTLQEGASSQAGAAQLQKEVAFLTQGPFGSLVKSSAEAYKLLESFKSGSAPTAGKTGVQLTEGLNQTVDRGRAVEQAQNTEANRLGQDADLLKMLSAVQLGQSTRQELHVDLKNEQTKPLVERYDNGPSAANAIANIGASMTEAMHSAYDKVADKLSIKNVEERAVKKQNASNGYNEKENAALKMYDLAINQNKSVTDLNNLTKPQTSAPTPVEINAARPNNKNLAPSLPISPDNDAAQQRQHILKTSPVPGTVLASTNSKADQTLTIKVQSTGIDGKTEERVLAKAHAQAIQLIETAKSDDDSFATVGHK